MRMARPVTEERMYVCMASESAQPGGDALWPHHRRPQWPDKVSQRERERARTHKDERHVHPVRAHVGACVHQCGCVRCPGVGCERRGGGGRSTDEVPL
eukprot:267266-Chlamydomonas_euryale.AAC.2